MGHPAHQRLEQGDLQRQRLGHPADANRVGFEFGNDFVQFRTVVREVHHQPAGAGKNRRAVGGLEAGDVMERGFPQRSDRAEIVQRYVVEEIGDKMRRRHHGRRGKLTGVAPLH